MTAGALALWPDIGTTLGVCEDVGRSCGRALARDRTKHEHLEILSNPIKCGSVTVPVHEPGSYREHHRKQISVSARRKNFLTFINRRGDAPRAATLESKRSRPDPELPCAIPPLARRGRGDRALHFASFPRDPARRRIRAPARSRSSCSPHHMITHNSRPT